MLKVVVLAISMLFVSTPAINGVLPEIRNALGLTQAQSEMFLTIPSIAILIAVLASNVIIEKFGMKKTVFTGLLLTGVGGVYPAFSQNFATILIARYILGTGLGLMNTSGVRYINLLFDESQRATLMGYRSAVEQIGRSALTLIAGALFALGWHMSFIAYSLAFIVAILFYLVVPEIKEEVATKNDHDETQKEKLPLVAYLAVPFIMIIVLTGSSIDIRFPAMATEIMGEGFNSSVIVAVKPIIGMIAATFFGKLHHLMGRKILYIAMIGQCIAALLVGFSGGNFTILMAGFLLCAIVPGWIFPFVLMMLSRETSGKAQTIAVSLVFASANISVFLMTPVVQMLGIILGNNELTAPYPILATTIFVTLLGVISFRKKVIKGELS